MSILGARSPEQFKNEVCNVALGDRTLVTSLGSIIRQQLKIRGVESLSAVTYGSFRDGDVR